MERRNFFAALSALAFWRPKAVAAVEPSTVEQMLSPRPPKLYWFYNSYGGYVAQTGGLRTPEAQQFLEDAVRDMRVTLAQGHRRGPFTEPNWLTRDADAGVRTAVTVGQRRTLED